jgi:hypothetical protein
MKMTAVLTIAILYRGGVSGTCPCPLGFLNVKGVNQNSIPVSFSIFPSSSVNFLPFSIHLFLSSEFSHFNIFSRLLNLTIMTYCRFASSAGLITFTPKWSSNLNDSPMNPCSHSSNSASLSLFGVLVTTAVTGPSFSRPVTTYS